MSLREQYALWPTTDGLEIACTQEFSRAFMAARSERHKYTDGGQIKAFARQKRFYIGFGNKHDLRYFIQSLHAWSDASDLRHDYVARECRQGCDVCSSEKFYSSFLRLRRRSATYLSKGIIALTASRA